MSNGGEYTVDYLAKVPQMMSRIVTVCHTVYHGVTQCPQIHLRCKEEDKMKVSYSSMTIKPITRFFAQLVQNH